MAQHRQSRTIVRPAAGLAVSLILFVTCLVLVSLVWPAPSVAAPAQSDVDSAQAKSQVASAPPYIVYVPLIVGNEPIPNLWQAEYYANENLDGDPEYTLEETRVDYDWGTGGPSGLPTDHFSVRWAGHWEFEAGEYTLFAYADDGMRLYLDDDPLPIIDEWAPGLGTYQATIEIEAAGLHKLTLEYFEHSGDAGVRLHWRRTDIYPEWQGTYYYDPWLEGDYHYLQTDSAIQFDWWTDCPDEENLYPAFCDRFSIAWEASPLFMTGTHRIHVYADDGYRLFIDDVQVGPGGWDENREDMTYDLYVAGEEHHNIMYNFHDQGYIAEARLWIEYLAHGDWYVEYYDNADLSDPPMKTGTDKAVFYDWGFGAPRTKLPNDGFSVRWSGQRYFPAGCYQFGIFVDDGVRLWVDGELLIDEWHGGRAEYHSPVTFLTTGLHDVVVEYYEGTGEAEIRFWWE